MNRIFKLISAGVFLFASSADAQHTYVQDKNHTKVGFTVAHFGISHVDGRFKTSDVTFVSKKEDFTDAVIVLTIDVKSIDTDIQKRDEDLKSEKWFNADKFPELIFKSTSFKKISAKGYKLEGNITIRGITKPISFDVTYNGKELNPMSKKSSAGFTVSGKLNRNDFQVGTPGGTAGDEIELRANAEFIID